MAQAQSEGDKKRVVTTRVTEDLHERIRVEAAKRDIPISEYIRRLARDDLDS